MSIPYENRIMPPAPKGRDRELRFDSVGTPALSRGALVPESSEKMTRAVGYNVMLASDPLGRNHQKSSMALATPETTRFLESLDSLSDAGWRRKTARTLRFARLQ